MLLAPYTLIERVKKFIIAKWNNKCSKLFHCTVLNILWRHLLSIRVQTMEHCMGFVFYNKPVNQKASKWVFVVHNGDVSFVRLLPLINDGGETMRNKNSGFLLQKKLCYILSLPLSVSIPYHERDSSFIFG